MLDHSLSLLTVPINLLSFEREFLLEGESGTGVSMMATSASRSATQKKANKHTTKQTRIPEKNEGQCPLPTTKIIPGALVATDKGFAMTKVDGVDATEEVVLSTEMAGSTLGGHKGSWNLV